MSLKQLELTLAVENNFKSSYLRLAIYFKESITLQMHLDYLKLLKYIKLRSIENLPNIDNGRIAIATATVINRNE